MIEFQVIKELCRTKESYLRYRKSLDTKYLKENFTFLSRIVNVIDIIYTKHPNLMISSQDLETMYIASYPVLKDADRKELSSVIARIFTSEVSGHLLTNLMESYRLRVGAAEVAKVALGVHDGKMGLEALQTAYSELTEGGQGSPALQFVSSDLEALYQASGGVQGLRWPLECLNKSFGPLRRGNMGFVFARPEGGKTTFVSHIATHMVQQVDKPVIWFNNEQPGEEVMIRLYQSLFGVTVQELFKNRNKYKEMFQQTTKGLLFLMDSAIIDRGTVESVLEQNSPSLVIFDQLDKIYGFKNDRYDLELGERYQWARELAKQYCPVIATTQADASGEGVKYLTMTNVSSAKTAKQAEADWILGIGASPDDDFKWYRYFNISKNKLLGDENTDPTLRHGRMQVILCPEIGRYQEL